MLQKVDVFLLAKFQLLGDKIRNLTGATNFVVAKALLFTVMCLHLTEGAIDFKYGRDTIFAILALLMVPLFAFAIVPNLISQERAFWRNPKFANRMAEVLSWFRKVFIIFLPLCLLAMCLRLLGVAGIFPSKYHMTPGWGVIGDIDTIASFLFFYFASVTPSKRKRVAPRFA